MLYLCTLQEFPVVFRGYRNEALARNGLLSFAFENCTYIQSYSGYLFLISHGVNDGGTDDVYLLQVCCWAMEQTTCF